MGHALAALRAAGLVAGSRGRPPRVVRPALSQSFDEMVSFSAWALQLGRVPGARTLELVRRPADAEIARRLALHAGTPVFTYTRLRLLDGEPVMIERSTFVEQIGRLLLDCDLDGGSVYHQLGQRGVRFARAHQSITATAASTHQARLLAVPRRAPLLAVSRQVFDAAEQPVEISLDSYRSDAIAITVDNRVAVPRAGVGMRLVSE